MISHSALNAEAILDLGDRSLTFSSVSLDGTWDTRLVRLSDIEDVDFLPSDGVAGEVRFRISESAQTECGHPPFYVLHLKPNASGAAAFVDVVRDALAGREVSDPIATQARSTEQVRQSTPRHGRPAGRHSMPTVDDHDPALRDRVQCLVKFLQELVNARSKPVLDYSSHAAVAWLDEPSIGTLINTGAEANEEILRIGRLTPEPPPTPPIDIARYIRGDLEDSFTPPTLSRTAVHPANQPFRVWLGRWNEWARHDRKVRPRIVFYRQLVRMLQELSAKPESLELVAAAGMLKVAPRYAGTKVHTHLITQPVTIEREEKTGDLVVKFAPESGPRLEDSQLLTGMDIFEGSGTRRLQDSLADGYSSPVDDGIVRYLKEWAPRALSVRVDVRETGSAEDQDDNTIIPAPALVLRKRGAYALISFYEKMIHVAERPDLAVPLGLAQLVEPIEPEERMRWLEQSGSPASALHVDDPLFPLPANHEQREIIDRLAKDSGVVVEGPPGTGKTHTIANMVSALLARGQRVLVTSEKAQALRVLRDKLPAELQELCVSITDVSRGGSVELNRSIAEIARRKSAFSAAEYDRRIADLAARRQQAMARRTNISSEIRKLRETETYIHGEVAPGYSGTLAQIARKVVAGRERFSWLPGPLTSDEPPFESAQILSLAEHTRSANPARRVRVRQSLPPLSSLVPNPRELKTLCDAANADLPQLDPTAMQMLALIEGAPESKLESIRAWCVQLHRLYIEVTALPPAVRRVADELLSGRIGHLWERASDVSRFRDAAVAADRQVGQRHVVTSVTGPAALSAYDALTSAMGSGVKWRSLFKSPEQRTVEALGTVASVDGAPPATAEAARAIAEHLRVLELARMGSSVLGDLGIPLDLTGSRSFLINEMTRATEAIEVIQALRLRVTALTRLLQEIDPRMPVIRSLQDAGAVANAANAVSVQQSARAAKTTLNTIADGIASSTGGGLSVEAAELAEAVRSGRFGEINTAAERYRSAEQERSAEIELSELRKLVADGCPQLANLIAADPSVSIWEERAETLRDAWAWRRASDWVEREVVNDRNGLVDAELEAVEADIARLTAQLAALQAWAACLRRMTSRQVAALQAYRDHVSSIGKGTGRHAEKFRSAARAAMHEAQGAVPAWVMPLQQVLASIPPEPGAFDVVIVDEASQADISSLFLLWLAPRVIVVGDDKQCAPSEVSSGALDPIFERLESYLPDMPEYLRTTLTPRSSVFALLRSRFGQVVRLREHFRCMPEIINWSSGMFYRDAPLVPVRQFGADRLPPLRTTFVEGASATGSASTLKNENEARALVDQLRLCLSDRAYDGRTFGVVVLQGLAQVDLIQTELVNRIDAEILERRRIRVGTPPDFQGDERSVIFLSLVIGPETRTISLTKNEFQRRFNVAASRAQDQLWLFHSVRDTSLSASDLRYSLLTYMQSTSPAPAEAMPAGVTADHRHGDFDTLFEQQVFLAVKRRGFHVNPQVEINNRRIDLVVTGGAGRLAVECDGDGLHPTPDQLAADLERERELRRCGWEFWRVRESEYLLDPEGSLRGLWTVLAARGIGPVEIADTQVIEAVSSYSESAPPPVHEAEIADTGEITAETATTNEPEDAELYQAALKFEGRDGAIAIDEQFVWISKKRGGVVLPRRIRRDEIVDWGFRPAEGAIPGFISIDVVEAQDEDDDDSWGYRSEAVFFGHDCNAQFHELNSLLSGELASEEGFEPQDPEGYEQATKFEGHDGTVAIDEQAVWIAKQHDGNQVLRKIARDEIVDWGFRPASGATPGFISFDVVVPQSESDDSKDWGYRSEAVFFGEESNPKFNELSMRLERWHAADSALADEDVDGFDDARKFVGHDGVVAIGDDSVWIARFVGERTVPQRRIPRAEIVDWGFRLATEETPGFVSFDVIESRSTVHESFGWGYRSEAIFFGVEKNDEFAEANLLLEGDGQAEQAGTEPDIPAAEADTEELSPPTHLLEVLNAHSGIATWDELRAVFKADVDKRLFPDDIEWSEINGVHIAFAVAGTLTVDERIRRLEQLALRHSAIADLGAIPGTAKAPVQKFLTDDRLATLWRSISQNGEWTPVATAPPSSNPTTVEQEIDESVAVEPEADESRPEPIGARSGDHRPAANSWEDADPTAPDFIAARRIAGLDGQFRINSDYVWVTRFSVRDFPFPTAPIRIARSAITEIDFESASRACPGYLLVSDSSADAITPVRGHHPHAVRFGVIDGPQFKTLRDTLASAAEQDASADVPDAQPVVPEKPKPVVDEAAEFLRALDELSGIATKDELSAKVGFPVHRSWHSELVSWSDINKHHVVAGGSAKTNREDRLRRLAALKRLATLFAAGTDAKTIVAAAAVTELRDVPNDRIAAVWRAVAQLTARGDASLPRSLTEAPTAQTKTDKPAVQSERESDLTVVATQLEVAFLKALDALGGVAAISELEAVLGQSPNRDWSRSLVSWGSVNEVPVAVGGLAPSRQTDRIAQISTLRFLAYRAAMGDDIAELAQARGGTSLAHLSANRVVALLRAVLRSIEAKSQRSEGAAHSASATEILQTLDSLRGIATLEELRDRLRADVELALVGNSISVAKFDKVELLVGGTRQLSREDREQIVEELQRVAVALDEDAPLPVFRAVLTNQRLRLLPSSRLQVVWNAISGAKPINGAFVKRKQTSAKSVDSPNERSSRWEQTGPGGADVRDSQRFVGKDGQVRISDEFLWITRYGVSRFPFPKSPLRIRRSDIRSVDFSVSSAGMSASFSEDEGGLQIEATAQHPHRVWFGPGHRNEFDGLKAFLERGVNGKDLKEPTGVTKGGAAKAVKVDQSDPLVVLDRLQGVATENELRRIFGLRYSRANFGSNVTWVKIYDVWLVIGASNGLSLVRQRNRAGSIERLAARYRGLNYQELPLSATSPIRNFLSSDRLEVIWNALNGIQPAKTTLEHSPRESGVATKGRPEKQFEVTKPVTKKVETTWRESGGATQGRAETLLDVLDQLHGIATAGELEAKFGHPVKESLYPGFVSWGTVNGVRIVVGGQGWTLKRRLDRLENLRLAALRFSAGTPVTTIRRSLTGTDYLQFDLDRLAAVWKQLFANAPATQPVKSDRHVVRTGDKAKSTPAGEGPSDEQALANALDSFYGIATSQELSDKMGRPVELSAGADGVTWIRIGQTDVAAGGCTWLSRQARSNALVRLRSIVNRYEPGTALATLIREFAKGELANLPEARVQSLWSNVTRTPATVGTAERQQSAASRPSALLSDGSIRVVLAGVTTRLVGKYLVQDGSLVITWGLSARGERRFASPRAAAAHAYAALHVKPPSWSDELDDWLVDDGNSQTLRSFLKERNLNRPSAPPKSVPQLSGANNDDSGRKDDEPSPPPPSSTLLQSLAGLLRPKTPKADDVKGAGPAGNESPMEGSNDSLKTASADVMRPPAVLPAALTTPTVSPAELESRRLAAARTISDFMHRVRLHRNTSPTKIPGRTLTHVQVRSRDSKQYLVRVVGKSDGGWAVFKLSPGNRTFRDHQEVWAFIDGPFVSFVADSDIKFVPHERSAEFEIVEEDLVLRGRERWNLIGLD